MECKKCGMPLGETLINEMVSDRKQKLFFVGDFRELKKHGFRFHYIHASNYKAYIDTGDAVLIWVAGRIVEIFDKYGRSTDHYLLYKRLAEKGNVVAASEPGYAKVKELIDAGLVAIGNRRILDNLKGCGERQMKYVKEYEGAKTACPYCGNKDTSLVQDDDVKNPIPGTSTEFHTCLKCKKKWMETWERVNVDEVTS